MYDLRITLNERASTALLAYAKLHNMDVYTAVSDIIMKRLEWAHAIPPRTCFYDCVENIRVRSVPNWLKHTAYSTHTAPRQHL